MLKFIRERFLRKTKSKKSNKEVVPQFLADHGYIFDGAYEKTDKYTRLFNVNKHVPIAPNVMQIQPMVMLLLAEKNRETGLFRLGMRIENREAVSPEMSESEFQEKIVLFQDALENKTAATK